MRVYASGGGGGSVDSVTSSLNHGEAERQQTLGGASDVHRDVSRGESPVLKAAAVIHHLLLSPASMLGSIVDSVGSQVYMLIMHVHACAYRIVQERVSYA